MARGRLIVSEAWVYASLCDARWTDPSAHRVTRFKHLPVAPLDLTNEAPPLLLRGKTVYLLGSRLPPSAVLQSLVEAAGATVLTSSLLHTEEKLAFCVAGELEDLRVWLRERLHAHTKDSKRETHKEVQRLSQLVQQGVQIVTAKVFIDHPKHLY